MAPEYKNKVEQNLLTLQNRLNVVNEIISRSDKFGDPCNLFMMKSGGQELDPQNKAELVTKMSPVLFNAIIEIIEGTYTVGAKTYSLKVIDQYIEFEFIALAK
mmetsp:Transcript_8703/g.10762  ORF Transcript_8703/g.10762 Transcript_8703/m.10762 type:complete len:103 (+) Transcript_8703:545-853(+)